MLSLGQRTNQYGLKNRAIPRVLEAFGIALFLWKAVAIDFVTGYKLQVVSDL